MPRILVSKNRAKKAASVPLPVQKSEFVIGDAICTECEMGGGIGSLLDTCDGCARSWHMECLELAVFPGGDCESKPPSDLNEPWLCDDCELRCHRCFLCKHYSHDETLWRCSEESCCKYYHHSCLRKFQRTFSGSTKTLQVLTDSDGNNFCPRHQYCGTPNSECSCSSQNDSHGILELDWRCIRCPITYHESCKPLDIHVVDFSAKLFSCMKHVMDGSSKLPLPDSFALLVGRRRLKLTQFTSLDDFLEAEEKKMEEKTKNMVLKGIDSSSDYDGSNFSPISSTSPRSPSIKIQKKQLTISREEAFEAALSKKELLLAGHHNGSLPMDEMKKKESGGTFVKGTRMKIRGFDPNAKPRTKIDLLRVESKEDRNRRMGLTGKQIKSSVSKRGSKERVSLMKWVAAQMKAFQTETENSDLVANNSDDADNDTRHSCDVSGEASSFPDSTSSDIGVVKRGGDEDASHKQEEKLTSDIEEDVLASEKGNAIDEDASNIIAKPLLKENSKEAEEEEAEEEGEGEGNNVIGGYSNNIEQDHRVKADMVGMKRKSSLVSLSPTPLLQHEASDVDSSSNAQVKLAKMVETEKGNDKSVENNSKVVIDDCDDKVYNPFSDSDEEVDEPLDDIDDEVEGIAGVTSSSTNNKGPKQPLPVFLPNGGMIWSCELGGEGVNNVNRDQDSLNHHHQARSFHRGNSWSENTTTAAYDQRLFQSSDFTHFPNSSHQTRNWESNRQSFSLNQSGVFGGGGNWVSGYAPQRQSHDGWEGGVPWSGQSSWKKTNTCQRWPNSRRSYPSDRQGDRYAPPQQQFRTSQIPNSQNRYHDSQSHYHSTDIPHNKSRW